MSNQIRIGIGTFTQVIRLPREVTDEVADSAGKGVASVLKALAKKAKATLPNTQGKA